MCGYQGLGDNIAESYHQGGVQEVDFKDPSHEPVGAQDSPDPGLTKSQVENNSDSLETKPETVNDLELNGYMTSDKDHLDSGQQGILESVVEERRTRRSVLITILGALVVFIIGVIILSDPRNIALAVLPTPTTAVESATTTPTWTPLASETAPITETPTITATNLPTETPEPPRFHQVTSGETLFSLSLRYGVSMESIAELNGLPINTGIQVSQELAIPWPTATPPLVPVAIEVGSQVIIADPTDCRMYEIQSGDTFLGIAHRERVDLNALIQVNRFSDQTILQPGDLICIPKIVVGGQLPPTPGPSPTSTQTPPPSGPHLLLPVNEMVIGDSDMPFFLQWAAVKDLDQDEWYMVEVTDLTNVDTHPLRGFTRTNSFTVPHTWRPQEPTSHLFRWRVQIVKVTGNRTDGSFIYTFGGSKSEDKYFYWVGAIPTPTQTFTPTITPTLD